MIWRKRGRTAAGIRWLQEPDLVKAVAHFQNEAKKILGKDFSDISVGMYLKRDPEVKAYFEKEGQKSIYEQLQLSPEERARIDSIPAKENLPRGKYRSNE